MTGAPSDVVVADAILRGVPGLDAARAYALLRPGALDADPARRVLSRGAMGSYFELGYLAAPQGGCVSRTTSSGGADFALENLARHLGRGGCRRLHDRRLGYRTLFDPATGFLRPHDAAGALADDEPFDAVAWDDDAFTEANAWQSLWMPASHDPEGFTALFGGRDATVAKLSEFFEAAEAEFAAIPPGDLTYLAFPRPYYWHGNEPDIHAAALFSQLGRPDLAQRWTRWIETITRRRPTAAGQRRRRHARRLARALVPGALSAARQRPLDPRRAADGARDAGDARRRDARPRGRRRSFEAPVRRGRHARRRAARRAAPAARAARGRRPAALHASAALTAWGRAP
jgi:putative alpha-1,2-mannosidase